MNEWKLSKRGATGFIFRNGITIGYMQASSDAEIAVRAVNSHDELVEALKSYMSKFGDCGAVYAQARDALARAERETP